jgi:hypothetical protein
MSAPAIPRPEALSISSSSVEELLIPFPFELQKVFNRLAAINRERAVVGARKHPSEETVDWAADVLLRVVPSAYLIGAEIDPFESEIHVTWENENAGKSVIVFFPGPRQIKMYWEWTQEGTQVREHQLLATEDVAEVSARLRWFFQ